MLPDLPGGFAFSWPLYAGALIAYLVGEAAFMGVVGFKALTARRAA